MADFRYFPSWSGLAPDHLTPIGHRPKNPAFSMVRKIAGDGRVTPDHDERGRQRSYAIALLAKPPLYPFAFRASLTSRLSSLSPTMPGTTSSPTISAGVPSIFSVWARARLSSNC